jgi:hypothetical protein
MEFFIHESDNYSYYATYTTEKLKWLVYGVETSEYYVIKRFWGLSE